MIDPGRAAAAGPTRAPTAAAAEASDRRTTSPRRIEGRLVATGVQAYLTRQRRAAARRRGRAGPTSPTAPSADLCISLHVDASANADAAGVATYFFGSEPHGTRSSAGERFAGLVQREIVARTDLVDLRLARQDLGPAARAPGCRPSASTLGYLTNPGDAARLGDPAFRDVVAEAIVVAVQRLYLAPEADAARPACCDSQRPRRRRGHRPPG